MLEISHLCALKCPRPILGIFLAFTCFNSGFLNLSTLVISGWFFAMTTVIWVMSVCCQDIGDSQWRTSPIIWLLHLSRPTRFPLWQPKYLQTFPSVPWEAKIALFESHGSNLILPSSGFDIKVMLQKALDTSPRHPWFLSVHSIPALQ